MRTSVYETYIFDIYIGIAMQEVIIEMKNGIVTHIHVETPQRDESRDARVVCDGVGELADACQNAVLDTAAELLKNAEKVKVEYIVSYTIVEE